MEIKNIGIKIQKLSTIILTTILLVGGTAFVIALSVVFESGQRGLLAGTIMIYSVVSIVSTIILYFPLYGFGQLIINSDIIVKQLSDLTHSTSTGTHESKTPTDLSSAETIFKNNQE